MNRNDEAGRPGLLARTMLFVPGGRADMIAKVGRSTPDVVVVDLEDAVAAPDKDTARRTAVQAIAGLDAGEAVVLVRVNPPGTPWFAADVAAAAGSAAAGVVLPKLERVEELGALRELLAFGAVVVAGLETALGVADCRALLATGVDAGLIDAVYFGAEDYIADLGGRRTVGGDEVLYARSQVALAARLAGIPSIDQAVVAVRDDDRFRADAAQGRDLGYHGKICLHPTQVAIAREVFTPSAAEIEHARTVVAASGSGVGLVDGQMVDDVHVRMATALLARAGLDA